MAYVKNLPVAYHQQDTGYYCGAACAQMVLDSIGAGLLDQDDLYTDNHNHSTAETDPSMNWATAPDGLTWTLNDRRPAGFTNPFVLFALASEDAASRKIAWTIEHYNVGPCALVMSAAHWIVVRGMETSDAPATWDDTGYTVTEFRVNDPWPPVPSSNYWQNPAQPPPPPHAAGDGCGTGGNRGVADEVISYATWENTYMTAVPQGYWNAQFVAVCDPDPPPVRRGPLAARRRLFDGERLIGRAQATRLVSEWLERRMPAEERWQAALRGASVSEPVLVQRLDRDDDFYYIVPITTRDLTTAAVALDARFGDFRQAVALPKPEISLLRVPSREAILKRMIDERYELPEFRGRIKIREDAVVVPEIWVWRPCLESLSPFWPFKMVMSGGHRVYVRVDGQVFTALHENVYGI